MEPRFKPKKTNYSCNSIYSPMRLQVRSGSYTALYKTENYIFTRFLLRIQELITWRYSFTLFIKALSILSSAMLPIDLAVLWRGLHFIYQERGQIPKD